MCVSVCASEAWWSGCRSQGSTGSGVRRSPRTLPGLASRDYNSQNAACPWGEKWGGGEGREGAREGGTKAGSKRRRRGQSQAAPVTLGGEGRRRGSLRGPSGFRRGRQRWLQQAGQKARLPGKVEELNLRGCKSPTPSPLDAPRRGRLRKGKDQCTKALGFSLFQRSPPYARLDFLRP